jgi:thioredoxin 1
MVPLDTETFEARVLGGGIALIDCWAPWCQACKEFTPIFERAAKRHEEHLFATLNTQEHEELTKRLKVTHIPTIILFRDGLLLLRQPGHLSESEIDDVIRTAETVDMEQIRQDMEARERGQAS